MTETIKETVTTQGTVTPKTNANSTNREATSSQTIQYLIYFFFGALESLLVLRLLLKLLGANAVSGFVRFIYNSTSLFILPFEGIFKKAVTQGIETTASVFEPAVLLALVIYGLLAIGIVKFISISSGEKESVS